MDSKKSKKTRSFGEPSAGSKASHASRSSAGVRPVLKDRTRSAPSFAPTQHEHAETSPPRTLNLLEQDAICATKERNKHLYPTPAFVDSGWQKKRTSYKDEHVRETPEVNIAVLGAEGVGKSTFIQSALDLKQTARSPSSSKKVSLDGTVVRIRLLEVRLEDVRISSQERILWPHVLGEEETPRIDGVLALYTVMGQYSVIRLPEVLHAFSIAAMPCALVSCKCDNPPTTWQVDPHTIVQSCTALGGIESFETSLSTSETHKRCISVILRNFMPASQDRSYNAVGPNRSRNLSAAEVSSAMESNLASTLKLDHRGAASGRLGPCLIDLATHSQNCESLSDGPSSPEIEYARSIRQNQLSSKNPNAKSATSTSPIIQNLESDYGSGPSDTPYLQDNDGDNDIIMGLGNYSMGSSSLRGDVSHSIEEESSYRSVVSGDFDFEARIVKEEHPVVAERPSLVVGATFDDLVDRLLSQPLSKSDVKFTAIFLCLYRKFAAPMELLSAIISRFEKLSDVEGTQILRTSSRLRILGIVAQWVADYPGDLAHAATLRCMTAFIGRLAPDSVFAAAAKEIRMQLDVLTMDDDTEWACSDIGRDRAPTFDSLHSESSMQTHSSTAEVAGPTKENIISQGTSKADDGAKSRSPRNSTTPSSSSSAGRSGSQSISSFQTLFSFAEEAQRQAELLSPHPRTALTKIQWHKFMEIPGEEIARELTRIDWIMFSSIRPRDLVRHVSLSNDEKDKFRRLQNVNRMINQFNHVAFWVANIILLRDKPKHRAKALEKFMAIAWRLRQLNNYNSLGAVIAGINGTAVHRLAQTRELLTPQTQKDFMRLEILMGTQKSHFAYRLAWENTPSERIPFLPLHRRDLVSAEEGNRTYVGATGRLLVNWKKFEVMGEVVVGIQRSQGIPYPNINRNEEVQRLILDGKFSKDDDELYERSIQLESPGVGESFRRRFNWFQR